MQSGWYDRRLRRVRDLSCGAWRIYLELEVRRLWCRSCGQVKRERLEFLTDNVLHTKRFAYQVGRRCRNSTIKEVADELHLDWHSVKELDKQYMRAQLARAGTPAPKVIGIDEISVRKRHIYRIVVSDLIRGRAIWFGGKDRSEDSMSQFFAWLGDGKSRGMRLAVMDMWKPFRNATAQHAPNAAILFDKFHVMRHLGEALDQIRKSEYARLTGNQRRFIKGQKYTLLSRRENLTLEGRQALKTLLAANKRLNTAYLLKESFGQSVGLRARGLGTALLRQLALRPQMAATQALREVCRDDRSSLGRNRCLLQAREQGLAWIRGGSEQQDPGDPAARIRTA